MAKLKGFYFSLDALTASMVLIATVGMLATFNPKTPDKQETFQLDYVEAAATQNLTDWNGSKDKDRKVLSHIYKQYYSGNPSNAQQTCTNYFNFTQKYSLYFTNYTERDKVCGTLSANQDSNLETRQVLVPDQKINGSFQGVKTAVMVMNN